MSTIRIGSGSSSGVKTIGTPKGPTIRKSATVKRKPCSRCGGRK